MKDSEFVHEYDGDWKRVTTSFWKKYCRLLLACLVTPRASYVLTIACSGTEPID